MPGSPIVTRYRVEGMDCPSCATKIDTALRRLPGISDIAVSVTGGTMSVTHDGNADLANVERRVAGLGFTIEPAEKLVSAGGLSSSDHAEGSHTHGAQDASDARAWWQTAKGRLTIASGVALALAFAVEQMLPVAGQWPFLAAMAVGLVPIARRAMAAAFAGTPFSIEMLMSIAAIGAIIIGAGEEAATVVFLFLIGELLEGVAAGKARQSIQALAALVPKTAFVEDGGNVVEVAASGLTPGAVIVVRPGDRIAADGVIVEGESSIDQSPVTGESVPVRKIADAEVFAGTVNGEGVLRIRVTSASADNTIARVVKLVEEAQESKAPTERFIDRFSRWYTPAVVVVAAITAVASPLFFGGVWDEWIYRGLAILLIGCPCALVISVPAAIAASLSAGARRGLLLKGGAVLEAMGKVTAVALDKTGTLTQGKPKVTEIISVGLSAAVVLRLAAALESGSSHPLAIAILAKAKMDAIDIPPASQSKAIGGKGVSAIVDGKDIFLGSPKAATERQPSVEDQGRRIADLNRIGMTASVLLVDNELAGIIVMRDEPRPDAMEGLKALTDAGIKIVMLTGDNQRTAATISQQLGGIEVRAELLPEDKQRIVGELQGQGYVVAKVGDGINDAPALAAADVGIAMGGGTDVALETADAAILHGRVGDISAMISLSKRTMRNISQNIALALGLKAVFLVTTIAGVTGLWPAILADTGATVLVTLNALRLLQIAKPRAVPSTGLRRE